MSFIYCYNLQSFNCFLFFLWFFILFLKVFLFLTLTVGARDAGTYFYFLLNVSFSCGSSSLNFLKFLHLVPSNTCFNSYVKFITSLSLVCSPYFFPFPGILLFSLVLLSTILSLIYYFPFSGIVSFPRNPIVFSRSLVYYIFGHNIQFFWNPIVFSRNCVNYP